jgi:hypothetical protein
MDGFDIKLVLSLESWVKTDKKHWPMSALSEAVFKIARPPAPSIGGVDNFCNSAGEGHKSSSSGHFSSVPRRHTAFKGQKPPALDRLSAMA